MKIKSLLLIAILGVAFVSCQDLDLTPKGQTDIDVLLTTEYGVQTYLSTFYGKLPIEDFVHYSNNGYEPSNYWEAIKQRLQNASGEFVNTWTTVRNDGHNYWPYNRIREVNKFISIFPDYKSYFLDEAKYNSFLGEAYFCRAFFYFGMVKRYGGVPIITDVQYPDDDPSITMVFRATEYETWKFIQQDLDFAIANLTTDKNTFRANKYTAAALQMRCMLYAATNAKYDKWLPDFSQEEAYAKGLAGIPESRANEFFQAAYDAGKVVESGGYTLYRKDADLATNFANLFLNYTSADNPEAIFVKKFDRYSANGLRLRHTWDSGMLPEPGLSNFVGSNSYPALDVMRLYDFPDIVDANGYPIRFDKPGDIREGIEPRARGCMWFNGDVLRGVTFSMQLGNYKTFNWKADVIIHGENGEAPNIITSIPDPDPARTGNIDFSNRILSTSNSTRYSSFYLDQWNVPRLGNATTGVYRYQGDHGISGSGGENSNMTGGWVRKYVVPTNTNTADYGGEASWIVFRLGEVYASMAEICYELGKEAEAFEYIKRLRERAGCKEVLPNIPDTQYNGKPGALYNPHTYPYSIDSKLQFIREERYRELWGENHFWWDIRRWRIAEHVRNQYRPRALALYYIIDEGKYIYLDERIRAGSTWTANNQCYYQGIEQAEINRNPNLLPKNPLR